MNQNEIHRQLQDLSLEACSILPLNRLAPPVTLLASNEAPSCFFFTSWYSQVKTSCAHSIFFSISLLASFWFIPQYLVPHSFFSHSVRTVYPVLYFFFSFISYWLHFRFFLRDVVQSSADFNGSSQIYLFTFHVTSINVSFTHAHLSFSGPYPLPKSPAGLFSVKYSSIGLLRGEVTSLLTKPPTWGAGVFLSVGYPNLRQVRHAHQLLLTSL